jgi:hypothetical protein
MPASANAFRHLGRGIVRAAGAVEGRAEWRVDGLLQHRILGIEEGQAGFDLVLVWASLM